MQGKQDNRQHSLNTGKEREKETGIERGKEQAEINNMIIDSTT